MKDVCSIYIHIPFCKSKCHYCDFVSYPSMLNAVDEYIEKLIHEIKSSISEFGIRNIKTIYIGGGTPGMLSVSHFERLFEFFSKLKGYQNAEITVELNPDSTNKDLLTGLKSFGVNRISLGAQSFDNEMLKILGRPHNSSQIFKAIEAVQASGINNISIDLMYGLPGQTIENWQKTLEEVKNIQITHISAYGLKIEKGTPFKELYPEGHEAIPSDEETEKMFLNAHQVLESSGFAHYEISNYAKPGFQSQHNLTYWQNEYYLGCGVAAHSYINKLRIANTASFEQYLYCYKEYQAKQPVNTLQAAEEEIFLNLRLTEGIKLERFFDRHGFRFEEKYKHILNKYADYFIFKQNSVSFNLSGMLLSNMILPDFLE